MPNPRPGRIIRGGNVTSSVNGLAVAAFALTFRGRPYVWSVWDCSGAFNHWQSFSGLPIPGSGPGVFRGPPPHGPVVIDWANWDGCETVTQPEPGDAAIWTGGSAGGHIGIVIPDAAAIAEGFDGSQSPYMISALDPAQGTAITPVLGTGPAGPFMFRRPLAYSGTLAPVLGGLGYGTGDLGQVGARLALTILLMVAGAGALAITAGLIIAGGGITGLAVRNRHRTRADF